MNSTWFWDWRAKGYDAQIDGDALVTRAAEVAMEHLEPHGDVLDFGCGTGVAALRVAPHVQSVLGIDTSERMIRLAEARARRSGATNTRFAPISLFDPGLSAGSFDAVLAFNILHLLEDPERSVGRLVELLKPGGKLISLTPCAGESARFVRFLLRLIPLAGILPHLKQLGVGQLSGLMDRAGFVVSDPEIHSCKVPSVILVAEKRAGAP